MDVGTIETIDELEEPKKRRGSRVGGPGPSGNGGGGYDGGDGDDEGGQTQGFNSQKSRVFTFFLLIAILMTFGGLMAAYVVIQANKVAEWRPFELPVQVWISTGLIIGSSFTYEFAKRAIKQNAHAAAKKWLIVTTALGAAFVSSQILVWFELTRRGLYMSGNPYAGFFYVLTAVHAAHVVGGICALGSILLRSWLPTQNEDAVRQRIALSQVVGWYWHFMGTLWVVLFILLGFWK